MKTGAVPALLVAALALLPAAPAGAQVASCEVFARSSETVAEGVTLTYDSSFWCPDAPPSGEFAITVTVTNDAASTQAATISSLELSHTSPRPRGVGPEASVSATGLPLTLAAGEGGSFELAGSYELVTTDQGAKANLHLRAAGQSAAGQPFRLGLNVHLRGPGATEGDDGPPPERAGRAGPPSWVPAPSPAEAGGNEGSGPPSWVPGPPPWAGSRRGS